MTLTHDQEKEDEEEGGLNRAEGKDKGTALRQEQSQFNSKSAVYHGHQDVYRRRGIYIYEVHAYMYLKRNGWVKRLHQWP